jgi:hypothetical protein
MMDSTDKGFQICKSSRLAMTRGRSSVNALHTYAILRLGGNSVITLAGILNGDSLLSVDRLARHQVGGSQKILFPATSNEDTLVTMGLDNNLLAALRALRTTPGTTAASGSAATTR